MVQRPFPTSAEMKPSLSNASLTQDYRPFQSPPAEAIFARPPPAYWAILYMDKDGNVRESSNLASNVFSPQSHKEFATAQANAERRNQNASLVPTTPTTTAYIFRHGQTSNSRRSGRVKRRRGAVKEELLPVEYLESGMDEGMDLVALEIGDTKRVTAYYDSAFKRLQQLNCRLLAKNFIKLIEPRKQVKHPYNGGRPPPGAAPGERGDPERTKPDWWPHGVIHKEPDHLRKDLRLKLLVHIVQNLLPIGITADKLQEVANDSRRHIKPPEKIAILDELFRVRRLEERFERNEVDANTVVYVIDHEGAKKGEPDSDNEDEHSGEPTPPESPETLSEGNMELTGVSQHLSPIDTTTSTFQMPSADVSFGTHDQQVDPFRSSQPEIGHHQAMVSTPITGSVMTPTGNQFLNHSPFASPNSHEQMHSINHPVQSQLNNTPPAFQGWSPHAYSQNMFAPVDYTGAAASRHVPAHHQMAYPAYTVCPVSHAHTVTSHTVPDLNRSQIDMLDMGNLPFRTGSLSHPNILPRPDGSAGPPL